MVYRGRFDVCHSQYTTAVMTGRTKRCITIHDAAFGMTSLSDYSPAKLKAITFFASHTNSIITVSKAARDDLQRVLPRTVPEIRVIYNGCSLSPYSDEEDATLDAALKRYHRPYVLFIGRMSRRKRVPLLISAFDHFRHRHNGTLILVGAPDDDFGRVRASVAGRSDIAWFEQLSEPLKAALFGRSDAFVYLSEYEGFGLPVAEAMLAQVPVVIAPAAALVEITRGTAIVIDPTPAGVADGITEALFGRRARYVREARAVASTFTWERAARETVAVYEELAAL